jgi:DNA-binding transcriptional LysR family regulator
MGIVGAELPIDQLSGHRLYLKTHNGCAYRFLRRRLRGMGRDLGEFANIVYYDDLSGVLRQVMAGHGIGFVSRDLAGREIEEGLLREHRVAGFGHDRPRTLLLSPRTRQTPSTRRFIATFFESLGQAVPGAFAAADSAADLPVVE